MGHGHGFGFGVGRVQGPSGSWTPEALGTDIEIWVRPEQLGAPASDVSTWPDQSGNGNDLYQTINSLKPTVVGNVVGSYSGAQSTVASGEYLVQTVFQTFNADLEFFYIYRKPATPANYLLISTLGSGSHYTRDNVNRAYQCVWEGTTRYLTPSNYTPVDGSVVLGSLRRESGNYTSALNGVDQPSPTTHTPGNHSFQSNVVSTFDGTMVEAIFMQRALTTGERASMNTYFAGKYPSIGITA